MKETPEQIEQLSLVGKLLRRGAPRQKQRAESHRQGDAWMTALATSLRDVKGGDGLNAAQRYTAHLLMALGHPQAKPAWCPEGTPPRKHRGRSPRLQAAGSVVGLRLFGGQRP